MDDRMSVTNAEHPGGEADLALVIPCYDEQVRLPRALERLARFAREAGIELQLIVADDGSDDGTEAIARGFARRPGVSVDYVRINHRGKGAAVRAGMPLAHAPVVGYCDVDLSAGPDAIYDLYHHVKGGADMAIASRGLPDSVLDVRQPWYREYAGRTFNRVLRSLCRIPFRDTQCGLKLMRQEVAHGVFKHQRLDGFAFDAEVVV
ncbi:MAG: glycosyltransferase, partial [Actinomycetota bacterium]